MVKERGGRGVRCLPTQQTPKPSEQEPDAVPPRSAQSPEVRQVPVETEEPLVLHSTAWTCAKTNNTAGAKRVRECW